MKLSDGEREPRLALPAESQAFVHSIEFERTKIDSTLRFCQLLDACGVKRPWFLDIGLWRVNRYAMGIPIRFTRRLGELFTGNQIDLDLIEIGIDADISSFAAVARVLKPSFDRVWREFGFSESMNYQENEWIAR